jgi:hypothetical protein
MKSKICLTRIASQMKKLEQFCRKNNLVLAKVNYRYSGILDKRIGYDICRPNGEIIISFEPVSRGKTKWFLRSVYLSYTGERYLSSITTKFLQGIDLKCNSHFYNSAVYYSGKNNENIMLKKT